MRKRTSLLVCLGAYAAAGALALGGGWLSRGLGPLWAAAVADLVATVVVFFFSMAFDNSSLYDPYWSVTPPLLAAYWLVSSGAPVVPLRTILLFALLLLWSVRLTANWAGGWRGLDHEDWRYVSFRRRFPGFYWPVSFLGIHLFPTIVVFLGCLSVHAALSGQRQALGALDLAAAAVTALAVWIEAAADRQLHRFLDTNEGRRGVCDSGLWALSRHPNYFGETLFWWGLFLFGLAASPADWWSVTGPVTVTALFLFVSVPMMDRHLLSRLPGYAGVMRARSAFLPWFPRRGPLDEETG